MKRAFHPPLFAIFIVLVLYGANVSLISYVELARGIGGLLLVSLITWACSGLLIRSADKGATVASLILAVVFSFSIVAGKFPTVASPVGLAIYLVFTLGFSIAVGRVFRSHDIANIGAMVLVAISLLNVLNGVWKGFQPIKEVSAGVISSDRQAKPTTRPEIFYFILDGFGRPDVLKKKLGLDIGNAIQEFEKLGFKVLSQSRANYCQTELSLASSLNMAPLQDLLPNISIEETERGSLDKLILDNALARQLQAYGYEFGTVMTGFPAFKFSNRELSRPREGLSFFESALLNLTPFGRQTWLGQSMFLHRRTWIQDSFTTISNLGYPSLKPKFVFVHILAPHPPFVFREDGSKPPNNGTFGYWDGSDFTQYVGTREEYIEGYRGQAQYILKQTLEAIRSLKRNSAIPPIIVIQGDHGPKSRLDQANLSRTDVGEVFPILNMVDAPPEVLKALPLDTTPVNTWRLILRAQFGVKRPLHPNNSYWSPFPQPYKFTDVTSLVEPAAARP